MPSSPSRADRIAALVAKPFAHRGLHGRDGLIENTRGAFEAAIAAGSGIELDTQVSADGDAAVIHDYALDRGAMDWLLVQVDPYVIERLGLLADVSPLSRPLCAVPDARLRARIELLGEWLIEASSSDTPDASVDRIIELLLLSVAEAPASDPVGHSDAPQQSERLLPALERLRTRPSEPLSLESAATLCRLSPTYFSRRFRQLFGMTFSDYSRIHRLHLAARRLVGGSAGISEIAFGVGFSSPAHFSARFRERFGMTPREYRASARTRAGGQGSLNA